MLLIGCGVIESMLTSEGGLSITCSESNSSFSSMTSSLSIYMEPSSCCVICSIFFLKFNNQHLLTSMNFLFWWWNRWFWIQPIPWCWWFCAHFQPMGFMLGSWRNIGKMHLLTFIDERFPCDSFKGLWLFINNLFIFILLINKLCS